MASEEFRSGYFIRPEVPPNYGMQGYGNRFILNALLISFFREDKLALKLRIVGITAAEGSVTDPRIVPAFCAVACGVASTVMKSSPASKPVNLSHIFGIDLSSRLQASLAVHSDEELASFKTLDDATPIPERSSVSIQATRSKTNSLASCVLQGLRGILGERP